MGIIKTFLVWSVCVLSSALLVATASNAQDKKTLTLGTGNPEGTALTNVTVQVFQPALRKHSNGNLDVKVSSTAHSVVSSPAVSMCALGSST